MHILQASFNTKDHLVGIPGILGKILLKKRERIEIGCSIELAGVPVTKF
jgi:hypothetical protein